MVRPDPILVKLPDTKWVPAEFRGKTWQVSQLLAPGKTNQKFRKTESAHTDWKYFGLSLSPHSTSGHNVCGSSTAGCRKICLTHQGLGFFPSVQAGRIAKVVAFKEHRSWFMATLRADLETAWRYCQERGFRMGVRLNVFSDILWEKEAPWAFREFPEVQHSDYTKHAKRMLRFLRGELPPNYYLTFSRSEANEGDCAAVLKAGGNVAVVFRHTPFPAQYLGYPVINGDAHDLRFLDERP